MEAFKTKLERRTRSHHALLVAPPCLPHVLGETTAESAAPGQPVCAVAVPGEAGAGVWAAVARGPLNCAGVL